MRPKEKPNFLLHTAFFAHHASASHLGLQLEAWPEEAVASDKLETGFIHTVTLSKTVTERLRNSDKCSEGETTESYLGCVGRWTKKLYRCGIKNLIKILIRFLSLPTSNPDGCEGEKKAFKIQHLLCSTFFWRPACRLVHVPKSFLCNRSLPLCLDKDSVLCMTRTMFKILGTVFRKERLGQCTKPCTYSQYQVSQEINFFSNIF